MFSFTFLHNGFDHVLFSTIVENSVAYHLSLKAIYIKIIKWDNLKIHILIISRLFEKILNIIASRKQ